MRIEELLPARIRSRYAVKLFAVSLLITAVIVAGGTVIATQVADRVTDEQLDSVEANAELEAESLARWFEGEQESIRLLSANQGIVPSNQSRTEATLETELERASPVLVSLHVVDRQTPQAVGETSGPSVNGTTVQLSSGTTVQLANGTTAQLSNGTTARLSNETTAQFSNETAAEPPAETAPQLANETPAQPSNGTTEEVVASTDPVVGEPLAATGIDWGETADGDEVAFQFNSTNETLVSWVYLDDGNMSVAIASPTRDGDHVLIGEYHPSTRVAGAADAINGTNTVVLGGVSGYVMFEKDRPNEFRPYKGDPVNTDVEARIEAREDQFAPLSGAELDATEVRGYHSVPSEGVNWVVVKEVPRSAALAVTNQVQSDLAGLIGLTFVGFLLLSGMIHYGPITSIRRVSRQAEAIADGDLEVEIPDENRVDEIGQLQTSLRRTKTYIETITEQAKKIAQREFDDDALDDAVPGPVGEAMANMRADLERFIAERKQREQRLEVFNRLLRHNLRNRLDVIKSHAEQLADQTDDDAAETVLSEADRLAAIGTRARRIDQLMSRDPSPSSVDLTSVILDILEDIDSDEIAVDTSFPETATLRTDPETLRIALASPLENALEYADSTVTVSLQSTTAGWEVAISDDGEGIPATELESLAAETETALTHGRGLGLWQLKWGVDALDGELSFDTEDGTTVTVVLPDLGDDTASDE